MNKPTFKESYDKIVEAYYKDEIKPLDPCFCFCGTLCNNKDEWFGSMMGEHYDSYGYHGFEFVRMETALLSSIKEMLYKNGYLGILGLPPAAEPIYEEGLFKGMCAAVEELKKIHIERGENIDEQFLTKRRLHGQD